ncbi:unnamed protein product [Diamesa serratosioi]
MDHNKINDFLSFERSEKTDPEKPKETETVEKKTDDIMDFKDVKEDITGIMGKITDLDIAEKTTDLDESDDEDESQHKEMTQSVPEIDFSSIDDDFMSNYTAKLTNKLNEPTNEKFISSEDLLSDFTEATNTIPIIETKKQEEATIEVQAPKPAPFIPEPVIMEVKKPAEEPKQQKMSTPQPSAPVAIVSDDNQIQAEKLFKNIGLDAWFKPDRLHPKVESLIYWRDVKKSGIVFGAGMAVLLAMSMFSMISVFAWISLLSLAGTISFRIYKTIMGAVQKTSEGHPFKDFLDIDMTLSQDRVQQMTTTFVTHVNAYVGELRRLFLVEDIVDSVKFALLLWFLTYIGGWFNGMTVVIMAYVAMFTLPKVYENNKQSIDAYMDLVRSKILEITDKVKSAIPIGGGAPKKVEESEKDK